MNVEINISEDSLDMIVVAVMEQMIVDMSDENLFEDDYKKYLKAFVDVHEFFTTHEHHINFMKSVE